MRYDYIDVEFHQLGREFGKAVVSALGPPILDDNVLALLVSELAKAHSQWVDEACVFCLRGHAEEADPVNLAGWLRARRKRPCNSRAADNLDKRPPPHAATKAQGRGIVAPKPSIPEEADVRSGANPEKLRSSTSLPVCPKQRTF